MTLEFQPDYVARGDGADSTDSSLTKTGSTIHRIVPSVVSCDPEWEAAYERFETPEEEVRKFVSRLRQMKLDRLPKDTQVVDICCGRGNGMVALDQLGFHAIEGVDLSEPLLQKYSGKPVSLYVADCRQLPFANHSRDLIIVQGGLHHLSTLPDDVEQTVAEVLRVLRPGGRFALVEPYATKMLALIHQVSDLRLIRRLSPRLDALSVMAERERMTYHNWLSLVPSIRKMVKSRFEVELDRITWTKWMFVGRASNQSTKSTTK